MGGQLTKEQALLPFGYVSTENDNKHPRTLPFPSITRGLHTIHGAHSSPESTNPLDSADYSRIVNTNTHDTSSLHTVATEISPEHRRESVHTHDHDGECQACWDGVPEIVDDFEVDKTGLAEISFKELPSLTEIGLCRTGLAKLSPNICFLFTTTTLQICCNQLTYIPAEIGYMKSLTSLDVSNNQLQYIPDTVGFLQRLVELKLSNNKLVSIPSSIGSLKKLNTLLLDCNRITELPAELGELKTLVTLDISENPITVIPAEIGRLEYLRKLKIDWCPLQTEFVHELVHSPPSLKELAARTIVRLQIPIPEDCTEDMKDYLSSAKKCSFCSGPYFESYVKRGKIIEKHSQHIPWEYRLCCPHWNTEQERVNLLFCPLPSTAPAREPYRRLRSPSVDNYADVGNSSIVSDNASVMSSQSKIPRGVSTRSININSLTRTPVLPNLPRMPRSSSPQLSIREDDKKKNTSKKSGLWRKKKNSAAEAILGKSTMPRAGNGSKLLLSRWRSGTAEKF
ncbi:2730_t:CDS:2 [Paraglomus occultum]|uniref:2730_t:CDS:1 n=1 Tax=Paraglomus occultum TaxID=144539 RepID=A0A9N9GBB6_9GLOM|nr:2730_t:CDS:2 [Paraglomus occultum]